MKAQEATRLEYGPAYAADEPIETPTDTPERVSVVNEGVTWAVLAVCLGGWAVIGFFLWIPRVLRAVILFSVSLVQSTVTETGAQTAGRRLRSDANFYRRGFVSAVESIRSPRAEAEQDSDEGPTIQSRLILGEMAWALFVWYLILWSVGFPELTPLDLMTLLIEAPWSEIWSSALQTLTFLPDLVR